MAICDPDDLVDIVYPLRHYCLLCSGSWNSGEDERHRDDCANSIAWNVAWRMAKGLPHAFERPIILELLKRQS